jgi:hypothetical protein
MACCTAAGACPVHKSHPPESSGTRVVSQAQADSCCAASERNESATAASAFVLMGSLPLTASPLPVLLPAPVADLDHWRALVPLPRSAVPKHVLLSVFLV